MDKKSVLQSVSLKITKNRLLILDILDGEKCFSARAVWVQLQDQAKHLGFATVYRTLATLTEAGIIRKIPAEGGALYERVQSEEYVPQLVCSRCGKVEDIDDPELVRYNADLMKQRGLERQDSFLMYANCKRKECDEDI